MRFEFVSRKLQRLYTDKAYTAGFAQAVVKAFRKVMQVIDAAKDERDLYALKSRRFEKLKGTRSHQRSLRLSQQWRLIVEIRKNAEGNVIVIVDIEDYH